LFLIVFSCVLLFSLVFLVFHKNQKTLEKTKQIKNEQSTTKATEGKPAKTKF